MKKIHVNEDQAGTRIDRWLGEQSADLSRSRIQSLIKAGQVFVNGKACLKNSLVLEPDDEVQFTVPAPVESSVLPENLPLEILYQDRDIVILNKAAGVAVHPAGGLVTGTLVNALLFHVNDLSGIGGEMRPGIVHRLDRVTSGVIAIAKNDAAHHSLSSQFKHRSVKKIYWALVHGVPASDDGVIDQPIARHPTERKRFAVLPEGRSSITRYAVQRKGLGGSFLELYPVTGRTHQIRVHLKHIGHPIIGDDLYGNRKTRDRGSMERHLQGYVGVALHARQLTLRHPSTNEEMTFQASVPGILQSLIEEMT